MEQNIAECINILGRFCGPRDVAELTRSQLQRRYGLEQADVMALFGGSILCGGDVLAEAIQNGVAKHYVIVGGEGHTTRTLREKIHGLFPETAVEEMPEAELFDAYIRRRYGVRAGLLECRSTNCGNNITCLLELLRQNNIPFHSIILAQDATMQRRMEAGMRKYAAEAQIINFATYATRVVEREGGLAFEHQPAGMWDMERYITLLMGEIPRLSDDAGGYGPQGRGYIAHVEIPAAVRRAFEMLKTRYGDRVRAADPRYASEPAPGEALFTTR